MSVTEFAIITIFQSAAAARGTFTGCATVATAPLQSFIRDSAAAGTGPRSPSPLARPGRSPFCFT